MNQQGGRSGTSWQLGHRRGSDQGCIRRRACFVECAINPCKQVRYLPEGRAGGESGVDSGLAVRQAVAAEGRDLGIVSSSLLKMLLLPCSWRILL